MKTAYLSTTTRGRLPLCSLRKSAGILITLFILCYNMNGQTLLKSSGFALSSSISRIGFGTQYSPSVFASFNKSKLELGPIIQKRDFHFSGMLINYEYTVFDKANHTSDTLDNKNMSLFFFSELRYYYDAALGRNAVLLEKQVHPESATAFGSLRYKAAEGYVGFGVKIKVLEKLKWASSIGIGGWNTLNGEKDLERKYNGLGVLLKSALILQLDMPEPEYGFETDL